MKFESPTRTSVRHRRPHPFRGGVQRHGEGPREQPVYATPGNAGTATTIGGQTDDFEIRRARINLNGKAYQHFEFVSQFDFAGGGNGGNGTTMKDVYVGAYSLGDWVPDIRAGQFYEPFGLDEMTSDNDFPMIEFAAPSNPFTPGRSGLHVPQADEGRGQGRAPHRRARRVPARLGDNGVGVKGTGGYAFTGRLTGLPWYDNGDLLHLGLAASLRSFAAVPTTGGATATPTTTYSSNPEAHLMSTLISTGAIPADGEMKLGGEAAFIKGPWAVSGEYYLDKVDTANTTAISDPTFSGYYAQVAYTLTGERRAWKGADAVFGSIAPTHNAFVNGGMGVGVALRWSNVDLTDGSLATGVRRLDRIAARPQLVREHELPLHVRPVACGREDRRPGAGPGRRVQHHPDAHAGRVLIDRT